MRATTFGEFEVQIDAGGRINIPRKLHSLFEHGGFLTRAFNGQSLVFWTYEAWLSVERRLETLEFTEMAGDDVVRYLSCGSEVSIDKQGRLAVPASLRQRAKLKSDVTLLAMGSKVEIWDSATWHTYDEERLTPTNLGEALAAISPRRNEHLQA